MTYEDIVARYLAEWAEEAARELRYYSSTRSLEEALHRAALSELPSRSGIKKRHPHQRRIPGASLRKAGEVLVANAKQFETISDFDGLHQFVCRSIGVIDKIGELACYDIAHRVGAYLGLEPNKVYLHAGTRTGARAMGILNSAKTASMDTFPDSFRQLNAAQVEDCLCLYKDELTIISSRENAKES